ncbi:MAG TPA: hypothetical protein DCM86_10970 [Verrucomicrobiales bacterium]|nr:hypothetical protein [Verrucomicrobiales bacterium]
MTPKSLHPILPALAVTLLASQSGSGADRYSLPTTDARTMTSYGDSFREDGATVSRSGAGWGDETTSFGNLKAHAGVRFSSVYDDNIIFSAPQRQKDYIFTVTPTFGFGLGDYKQGGGNALSLQYEPSWVGFMQRSRLNSLDHDVRLAGSYTWSKLSVGLSQQYLEADGTPVELGTRVRSRVYSTFLGANYQWTDKTSFTLNGRQNISDYDQFNRINDWTGELLANWAATEKVRLSVGGAYGLRDTTPGPNEEYEQALLRAHYAATEKLSADASVGMEFRQFQSNGSEGPGLIFGLGSTWTPRDDWSFTLEGHRRDQASISSGGVNVTVTGVSGIVRKQILTRYYLGLAGSYDRAGYRPIGSGISTARKDHYWSISPSFDCNFTERWTMSLFYLYRDNESGGGGTSFSNNQVGLRTAYRF